MGYPIPYAGVLPKLLFTAAISMSTIRDLCISLLEYFGIITMAPSHNYDSELYFFNAYSSSLNDYPSQSYFNPHLHSPSDHPLFLRRTAFFEAVQASLPAVLYESLPLNRIVQECADADPMQSSHPSSSTSSALEAPAEWSQHINLQELVNSLGLGDSMSSSLSLMSSLSPSSSSSSLCSAASHVSGNPPTIPHSDKRIERFVESEASSSHNAKTPPGVLSTAYDLQIKPQKPAMSTRSSAAYVATAEAYISQYDQLQEHRHPAPTVLSLPCLCDATVASSHADNHLQQRTVPHELENQAPAARSPISACGAPGSSCACNYHLRQRAECAVCLCEFERGDEVRELPLCSHIFHKNCIDGWLLHNHRTCPLCRSSLLTPAIEMQEKMRDQELSDQLTSWFNSLQQEDGAAYQEHYLQHLHLDHHQDFYYTLQPAGN